LPLRARMAARAGSGERSLVKIARCNRVAAMWRRGSVLSLFLVPRRCLGTHDGTPFAFSQLHTLIYSIAFVKEFAAAVRPDDLDAAASPKPK
jgi:hypothetical protein